MKGDISSSPTPGTPQSAGDFVPGLPPEALAQMREDLCRPKGNLGVLLPGHMVFPMVGCRLLMRLVAGRVLCQLERKGDIIYFTHASPGEGTCVACAVLATIAPASEMRVTLSWSHAGTSLLVQFPNDSTLIRGDGACSTEKHLIVGEDGNVGTVFTPPGMEIMSVRANLGGKLILTYPAIMAWRELTKAVKLLLEHQRTAIDDYLLKILLANQALSMLVTGYETYCEDRFVEMAQEGRLADFNKLAAKFLNRPDRERGIAVQIIQQASREGASPVVEFVRQDRINFQNFGKAKTAYAAAYGVRFGEIGVANSVLEDVQRFTGYRHRIVHVSPMLGVHNESEVPEETPILAGFDLSSAALYTYNTFIIALHERTLLVEGPSGA